MADFVEGETSGRDFTIEYGGVPFNGTGTTVTLVLHDYEGSLVDTTGDVAWVDAAIGQVRYTPDQVDLVVAKSPYTAHFKLTPVAGGDAFFPQGRAMIWRVHKP